MISLKEDFLNLPLFRTTICALFGLPTLLTSSRASSVSLNGQMTSISVHIVKLMLKFRYNQLSFLYSIGGKGLYLKLQTQLARLSHQILPYKIVFLAIMLVFWWIWISHDAFLTKLWQKEMVLPSTLRWSMNGYHIFVRIKKAWPQCH